MRLVQFFMMFCLLTLTKNIFAQVQATNRLLVSETTDDIHNSAALEVNSESKGLLLPRLTENQMLNDIDTPVEGLVIFCTDCESRGIYLYTDQGWQPVYQPAIDALILNIDSIEVSGVFVEGEPGNIATENPATIKVTLTNTTDIIASINPRPSDIQNSVGWAGITVSSSVNVEVGTGKASNNNNGTYNLAPDNTTVVSYVIDGIVPTIPDEQNPTNDENVIRIRYDYNSSNVAQAEVEIDLRTPSFEYVGPLFDQNETNPTVYVDKDLYQQCGLSPSHPFGAGTLSQFSNFTLYANNTGQTVGLSATGVLFGDNPVDEGPDTENNTSANISFVVAANYNNSTYMLGKRVRGPYKRVFVISGPKGTSNHALRNVEDIDEIRVSIIGAGGSGGGASGQPTVGALGGSGGGGGSADIVYQRQNPGGSGGSWPTINRIYYSLGSGGAKAGIGNPGIDGGNSYLYRGGGSSPAFLEITGGKGGEAGFPNNRGDGGDGGVARIVPNNNSLPTGIVPVNDPDSNKSALLQNGEGPLGITRGGNAADTRTISGGQGGGPTTNPDGADGAPGEFPGGGGAAGNAARDTTILYTESQTRSGGAGANSRMRIEYFCPSQQDD